jgi:HEAT repeat protein
MRLPFLLAPLLALSLCAQQGPSAEEAKANQILTNGISDKNPDTRKEAAAAMGLTGPREPYLTLLGGAMTDKDVYVRLSALASTVDLRQKEAIPALQKALYDETAEVSFAAAKALWSLGDPAGRAFLMGVISGENKTTSGTIAAKKRDMVRLFHTPHSLMMFAFREGAGLAPVPGAGAGVASLTAILADPNISGRATSLLLLSSDRSADILGAERDGLRDKDASVRAAAVHTIAVRDDPALMSDLLPIMDDSKEAVRLRAAAGYVRLYGIKVNSAKPAGKASAKSK